MEDIIRGRRSDQTAVRHGKRILNSALQLEIETSEFYENACKKTQGPIREIFENFLAIERRHEDIVQIELDHASNSGHWFNFMEIDMEHG